MCSGNKIYILFVLLLHAFVHIYAFVSINCVCFCVFFSLSFVSLLFIFALSSVFYLAFCHSHFPSHIYILPEEKWFFFSFPFPCESMAFLCVSIARWHRKKRHCHQSQTNKWRETLLFSNLFYAVHSFFLLNLIQWTEDWLQIKKITLKLLTKSNFRFGISSYYFDCNNVEFDACRSFRE